MDINLEVCRSIAIQHGLPLQFIIKEFHVFNVLSAIVEFTTKNKNASELVFKGGTALSKVYLGKVQRFSEDLDFDLDANLDEVKKFSKVLSQNMKDYSITEFRKVHGTIQFYCNYDNRLGERDHIRIDIASKKIITSKSPIIKPAFSEFTQSSVSGFYVYELEDLLSRKINALCERTEGKDLYDVVRGLPLCKRINNAITQMLKSEEKKEDPKSFLQRTIESVKKADYKKLRNLTNSFIPARYRPTDWLEFKNNVILKLETELLS